ncbi:hypothetical protein [Shinella sp. NM-101]|uniref:hypothetical protein n=1 Tax=Shinella sp. NM-101 TaxID=2744455 RepID=UPI001F3F046F|nr:hypothetical protein [Shinella sp. NM-101]
MQRPLHQELGHDADQRDGRPEIIFLALPFLISGAVAGFFLAGHITLSAVAFGGVAIGCVLGWWARGLTGKGDAG